MQTDAHLRLKIRSRNKNLREELAQDGKFSISKDPQNQSLPVESVTILSYYLSLNVFESIFLNQRNLKANSSHLPSGSPSHIKRSNSWLPNLFTSVLTTINQYYQSQTGLSCQNCQKMILK